MTKIELNKIDMKVSHANDKHYHFLSTAFTIILLASNIAAIKVWNFYGYIFDGGTIIFPLLYVIGDISSEVYGLNLTRKIIRKALLINILFSLFLYITTFLPSLESVPSNAAYNTLFKISPRIFIASVVSYYIGEILNANIIIHLKSLFNSKFFVIRAIISTFIGSGCESLIFCVISFYGILTFEEILTLAFLHTLIKITYEILVMPITVWLVGFFKSQRD